MISKDNKKRIAIIGCWEVRNYGSHLTYYALYRILKEHGYHVLMVGCPKNAPYKSDGKPEYFRNIPYSKEEICEQFVDKIAMRELNKIADVFIVGSDQLWYPPLYRYFGRFAFLDYVFEDKKKISYATSFGKSSWNGTEAERQLHASYLKRFDYVSVRESSGIQICEKIFDVKAEWRLDPVFLCDPIIFSQMADTSSIDTQRSYLAAYILDCDNVKAACIADFSKKLNCDYRILKDPNLPKKIKKRWNQERNFCVEDWMKWIRDSEYVITDSFHGMCVALLFRKKIIIIKNARRGIARFEDYGEKLGISNLMISDFQELNAEMFDLIDYNSIFRILNAECEKSLKWLYDAIESEKENEDLSCFDVLSLRQDELFSDMEQRMKRNTLCHIWMIKVKSLFMRCIDFFQK